ncbi:endonuclease/exonuclease/phosphatase family protein [Streptomyces sp. NBC_01142]|uniref:endonuclease/exonuclease/phosphatase family protein n=1 Tax=Streptomyces sp. NBC_01142 TaxID=2975865 RepID=UPI00225025AD|nr:endonuclease/exonuclease/phosphatase family protein [Streptomyces sp. NBC_01142]MCX4824529.1 endonuclease/exonuclease/phosphatase family protein [Streptomyces sp. NBC_01142]
MTIRIATFNAENLFRRPRVFALEDSSERRKTLEDFAILVSLLDHETYTAEDKEKIVEILRKYDVPNSQSKTRLILVNETRGGAKLFRIKRGGAIEIIAKGRSHWVGWAEMVRDDLNWEAVQNTALVIAEVDADVLLTVEVEDRLALHRFNEQVLGDLMGAKRYPFNMLIDGNDSRGIDLGLFSRHPIASVRSHIFDTESGLPVFSRDCPEFEVELTGGKPLWILGNHFKSKGFGRPAVSANRRKAQAKRVKEIYRTALERSASVVVAGDLNDTPDSEPLGFLLGAGLRDAMDHSSYTGAPGTYGTGNSLRQKLDYLMFSPDLWKQVEAVDVERRGIWAPNTFKSFETVTSKANQASDHAALYADLDV